MLRIGAAQFSGLHHKCNQARCQGEEEQRIAEPLAKATDHHDQIFSRGFHSGIPGTLNATPFVIHDFARCADETNVGAVHRRHGGEER